MDFLEFINLLLRDPLIVVALLGTQIAEIVVDFSSNGAILVAPFVRRRALAEDSECPIIAITHDT